MDGEAYPPDQAELLRAYQSAGLVERLHELRRRVRRCRRIASTCGSAAAARAVEELAEKVEAEAAMVAAQMGAPILDKAVGRDSDANANHAGKRSARTA